MHTDIMLEIADGIGIMTFNRPAELNSLSPDLVEGMINFTAELEDNPDVRCVVIRGAGDTFMAGGNINEFHASVVEDQAAFALGLERRVVNGHLAVHRLRRMAKPVLVSAQGAAVGYGISVVCAGDLAIASEETIFSLAYRHIGLTADGGVSYFLPRIVGERRALEIALLGDRFTAAKALEWGIVNWVVPRAQLEEETMKIARKLADGPPFALGAAKRLLRQSLHNSWEEQSVREGESIRAAAGTADHREGLTAFLEKRRPVFTGK